MTCRYLTSRTVDTDPAGRPVLAHGYTCGQPAVADDACTDHLTAAAGLSPRPLYGWAGPRL
ncbi:hypothetical protein ACFWDI_28540 [Streptomyces sp. NPDC060064]|uniref:hypothetical protein n=1 Tax=Streptomyces sp. NPDC060064 TaxID=3347049 RepID=UPI0036B81A31